MTDCTLALDIGGTKIAAGLVDADGTLVHRAQQPDPARRRRGGVGRRRGADRRRAAAGGRSRRAASGIASAGPIDLPGGTVSPINITAWQRFPIVDRVAAAVPGVPVRLGGDGLCMALGERWRGAGPGRAVPARAWWCRPGSAADWCSTARRTTGAPATPDTSATWSSNSTAAPCTCGGRGCVETVASGPHLAQWARDNGWDAPAGRRRQGTRGRRGRGDPVALRAFRRGATAARGDDRLGGRGVRPGPGGDRRAGSPSPAPLLFDPLREALACYAGLDFIRGLRVVPAELGGDAGLVGAAALAISAR